MKIVQGQMGLKLMTNSRGNSLVVLSKLTCPVTFYVWDIPLVLLYYNKNLGHLKRSTVVYSQIRMMQHHLLHNAHRVIVP